MLHKLRILSLLACCLWFPALSLAAAPVAVFPLQELGAGRNEVNLPFTRLLIEQLATSGNEVNSQETVIAFMAQNRIRSLGHLETFYVNRVRDELGAAFVLLGTVSQSKERPLPSLGLTLQLVRTTDARIVWSYVGHVSVGDERRMLGLGEPRSTADLQQLLLEDLLISWPWETIREAQLASTLSIDAVILEPEQVRPGGAVYARVRLRNVWLPGRAPRVFFRADDQLHAAQVSIDGSTYEASWTAGEKNGRFPVTLILEWPLYGRKETALLGTYLVDGQPPLIEIDLRGTQIYQGKPVFRRQVVIIPRLLVRKPLQRWRLAFIDAAGSEVGAQEGEGNLPERFIWQGRAGENKVAFDGDYEVVIEAWDLAGNLAKATREVTMDRSLPEVALSVSRDDRETLIEVEQRGKVPLAHWRMEMWTREGKFLSHSEGTELPAQVGIDLPDDAENSDLQGVLVARDILGNWIRHRIEDILPKVKPETGPAAKKVEPAGISETWVDEF